MHKKNDGFVTARKVIGLDRTLKQKACVNCGSLFVPSFMFEIFCAFCTTEPSSSFLTIKQKEFSLVRTA